MRPFEIMIVSKFQRFDNSGPIGGQCTGRSGNFKWFVLFTYMLLSMSFALSWLTFAPVPKQTASYFGITG